LGRRVECQLGKQNYLSFRNSVDYPDEDTQIEEGEEEGEDKEEDKEKDKDRVR